MSGRRWPNIRVLRDVQRREAVQSTEVLRRAYLYLARSENLPARVRRCRYRTRRPEAYRPSRRSGSKLKWLWQVNQSFPTSQGLLLSRNGVQRLDVAEECLAEGSRRGCVGCVWRLSMNNATEPFANSINSSSKQHAENCLDGRRDRGSRNFQSLIGCMTLLEGPGA